MSVFTEKAQQIRRFIAQGKVKSGLETALGLLATAKSGDSMIESLIVSYQNELIALNDQYKQIDAYIRDANLTNVEGNAQMSQIGVGVMEILDQVAENAEKIEF